MLKDKVVAMDQGLWLGKNSTILPWNPPAHLPFEKWMLPYAILISYKPHEFI